MAGNEDACKYIVLMFIAVLSRLFQDRRRRRFQQRLRLLAIRSRRRRIETCFFQRMLEDLNFRRRRKSVWVWVEELEERLADQAAKLEKSWDLVGSGWHR